MEELVGKQAAIEYRPRHPADVLATWADIAKAKRLLGWEPRVAFEDGVRRAVEWYMQNREWVRDVSTEGVTVPSFIMPCKSTANEGA